MKILKYLIRAIVSGGNGRVQVSRHSSNGTKSDTYEINGKCWVVDADDIDIKGKRIRMAGIDAPESDQIAVRWNGTKYKSGEMVKRMLAKKIGGKMVKVRVDGTDKYEREIGTVFLHDEDINSWMVRNGMAISAFTSQYQKDESFARKK